VGVAPLGLPLAQPLGGGSSAALPLLLGNSIFGGIGGGPHLGGGARWPAPSPDAAQFWCDVVVVLRQDVATMVVRQDFDNDQMCGAAANASLGWGDRGGGAVLPRRARAAEVQCFRRKPSLVSWRNGGGTFGRRSSC
jgi:hypothetical protein